MVSPNVKDEICVRVLNVNEVDVEIASRTRIGNIINPNGIMTTQSDTYPGESFEATDDVRIDKSLSAEQKDEIKETIRKHEDIIAENGRKPKRVNHAGHRIRKSTQSVLNPGEYQ